jgi:hypothetical protein
MSHDLHPNYTYESIITKEELVQRKRAIILNSRRRCIVLLMISKIIDEGGSINAHTIANRLGIGLGYARSLLNEFVWFHNILGYKYVGGGMFKSRVKLYIINDKMVLNKLIDDIAKKYPEIVRQHNIKTDNVNHTKKVVKNE